MSMHTLVAALAVTFTVQTTPPQSSGQAVYQPGNGVTTPVLLSKVDPQSTEQAKAQKITGEVWLDVVVKADGTVDVVRVIKSPNGGAAAGLDQAAIDAAKQWLFKPGMKNGTPVPVRVVIIQEFRPSSQAREGEVYKSGRPIRNPVVKSKVDPTYTREAMQAKIQGEVWIDAIVETDGTIKTATVQKSLDDKLGLDDAALDAAKQWKFQPGTLDGKPVRAQVTLVLEFRLH